MAGLREIWSHSSWGVWIKRPSSQDLRNFLGAWTMRKETHLQSLSPPGTSFPSSFEGGSSAASLMSLVLEEWPVLGDWVSISSLWGTHWAGTSQWSLALPTGMAPADSVPPMCTCPLFVPCSIPSVLAFPHCFFFFPTQNLHKELRLLEGQSQRGYLRVRNFWLCFKTQCELISQWISPPPVWAGLVIGQEALTSLWLNVLGSPLNLGIRVEVFAFRLCKPGLLTHSLIVMK